MIPNTVPNVYVRWQPETTKDGVVILLSPVDYPIAAWDEETGHPYVVKEDMGLLLVNDVGEFITDPFLGTKHRTYVSIEFRNQD